MIFSNSNSNGMRQKFAHGEIMHTYSEKEMKCEAENTAWFV